MGRSPVVVWRSSATHLAGSTYSTRESCSDVIARMLG
ncbi:Uncharacterised protein [Mycobacteroides abscessus subsp. abscessus]|nr:Uncharacterised protein [Mycobacteroides abscessus subsp. abscessus]